MPAEQKKRTVAEVVIGRVGFTKALRVQIFVACWWIATADLERPPVTIDEYCLLYTSDAADE